MTAEFKCTVIDDANPDGVPLSQWGQPPTTGLQIGDFTLTRYDEGSYWLAHKDGEGMQVKQERLQALVDELWKEF